MLASIEMQISGEPFAQLLGRDLAGYDRFSTHDRPLHRSGDGRGRSPIRSATRSAIESYEYSKQPMNNLSFESGAGLVAPVRAAAQPGQRDRRRRRSRCCAIACSTSRRRARRRRAGGQQLGRVAGRRRRTRSTSTAGPASGRCSPSSSRSIPRSSRRRGATRGCSFAGGYAAASTGVQVVGDYECGYNSLNLPNREQQVDKVLEPDALGFAMWKQGAVGHQLLADDARRRRQPDHRGRRRRSGQGRRGRQQRRRAIRRSRGSDGQTLIDGVAGTYLGDIPLEGLQGLIDARRDATTSRRCMLDAPHHRRRHAARRLRLDEGGARLRLLVAAALVARAVAVTETATDHAAERTSWKFFPQPTAFTITDARRAGCTDLTALAGGFAELLRAHRLQQPAGRRRSRARAPPSTAIRSPPTTSCPTARTRRTIARSPSSRSRSSTSTGCTSTRTTSVLVDDVDRARAAPCSAAPR